MSNDEYVIVRRGKCEDPECEHDDKEQSVDLTLCNEYGEAHTFDSPLSAYRYLHVEAGCPQKDCDDVDVKLWKEVDIGDH
jgi:hypothetical protein